MAEAVIAMNYRIKSNIDVSYFFVTSTPRLIPSVEYKSKRFEGDECV